MRGDLTFIQSDRVRVRTRRRENADVGRLSHPTRAPACNVCVRERQTRSSVSYIRLITLVIPKHGTNAIGGVEPLSSELLTSRRHLGALRVHSLNSFSSPIHRPPFLLCSLISVLSGGPETRIRTRLFLRKLALVSVRSTRLLLDVERGYV